MKTGCLQGLGSGPVCLPHFSHEGVGVVSSYPMVVPSVLEMKRSHIGWFSSSDTLPRMSSLRLRARDNLNEEEEDDEEEEPNFDDSEYCISVALFLFVVSVGVLQQNK